MQGRVDLSLRNTVSCKQRGRKECLLLDSVIQEEPSQQRGSETDSVLKCVSDLETPAGIRC